MNASDFGQLVVFHTIAQEKSITAAAKKLHLAVPSVSKSLKQLEKRIGAPLFTRTTRTIQFTDAGLQLWQTASLHLEGLQQAFEQVSEQHQTPRGVVRITLSQVHFDLIFKAHLAEFYDLYPQITLDFSINNAAVNLLEEGFDLGVRFGNLLADNFIARKIYPAIRQGLYASQAYAAKHGVPQTIDELASHRTIGFYFMTAQKVEPFVLNVAGERQEIVRQHSLILNDTDKMADAIAAGAGIGRVFETKTMTQTRDFVPVLPAHWVHFPESFLYFAPNRYKAKRVQAVIDFWLGKVAGFERADSA